MASIRGRWAGRSTGAGRASAVIVTWFVEFGDKVEGSVIAPGTWTHRWARGSWSCRPRRTSGELALLLVKPRYAGSWGSS